MSFSAETGRSRQALRDCPDSERCLQAIQVADVGAFRNIALVTSLARLRMRLVGFKFSVRFTQTKCTKTKVIPLDLRMLH